jgi:hypothetical protein
VNSRELTERDDRRQKEDVMGSATRESGPANAETEGQSQLQGPRLSSALETSIGDDRPEKVKKKRLPVNRCPQKVPSPKNRPGYGESLDEKLRKTEECWDDRTRKEPTTLLRWVCAILL